MHLRSSAAAADITLNQSNPAIQCRGRHATLTSSAGSMFFTHQPHRACIDHVVRQFHRAWCKFQCIDRMYEIFVSFLISFFTSSSTHTHNTYCFCMHALLLHHGLINSHSWIRHANWSWSFYSVIRQVCRPQRPCRVVVASLMHFVKDHHLTLAAAAARHLAACRRCRTATPADDGGKYISIGPEANDNAIDSWLLPPWDALVVPLWCSCCTWRCTDGCTTSCNFYRSMRQLAV